MEESAHIQPQKKSWFKRIIRFLLWTVLAVILLLGIGVGLVIVYEDEVKAVVIKELNKHLATEVRIDPKNIDLTFISSFPKCAIEFKQLTALETPVDKQRDTLLYAESLSLRFSLKDIFAKKYDIKQIALSNARCYLKVNKEGKKNYEAWKTNGTPAGETTDSLNFKLEDIQLKNVFVSYKNSHAKIKTECTIKHISFNGNFSEANYEMETNGEIAVKNVIANKTSFLKNKLLRLDLSLVINGHRYLLKKADLAMNKMLFDITGSFNYKDSLQSMDLEYKAKNLDIESVLSLLPDENKARIKDYNSSGEFFVNGNFNFKAGIKPFIKTDFGVKNATIEYMPNNSKVTDVVLAGQLMMDQSQSYLKMDKFNANLNGDAVKGSFSVYDFNEPLVELLADGSFNLQNLYSFWPVDTLEKLEGRLEFNGEVKGLVKDLKQNAFSEKVTLNLGIKASKLKARFKHDASDVSIESCKLIARDRNISVEDFRLMKGASDINLTGEIPGMFNYILDNKAPLVIKGKLESSKLAMEDFIFGESKSSATNSEFNLPENVNLLLDASIQHFIFGKFEASRIEGNFELKKQRAMVSDMKLETMGGEAVINAFADATGKNLDVTLDTRVKNIDVKKLFYQMNNFGQSTLEDKNINGNLTAQIDFSGSWDKKLEPLYNTIVATSDFTIEQGELIDFSPLQSLARFVDLQELKRIKFSTLNSTIEIKKGTIYIPQTTIKNSVLNIDFNGTHTFNNDIDYHIRLLISDLLSKKRKADDEFGPVENDPDNRRSAFILMTGNLDNPVIKYDKKGLKQKIKEDIKQEKQNLKQLLKEEFGAFKRDTLNSKAGNKSNQKFELEKPNNNSPKKPLEPKKKEDDDDF